MKATLFSPTKGTLTGRQFWRFPDPEKLQGLRGPGLAGSDLGCWGDTVRVFQTKPMNTTPVSWAPVRHGAAESSSYLEVHLFCAKPGVITVTQTGLGFGAHHAPRQAQALGSVGTFTQTAGAPFSQVLSPRTPR